MQTVSASDYHDIVKPTHPRVSPDGERVAFVRKTPDDDESYEATVHVVPLGGGDARQFTVSEGVDTVPRWSPSGDRLAFVSTRGADDDRPQLWVLPTTGGEARQVTDVPGGVSGIAWSPDGSRIVFTQRTRPDEREQGIDCSVAADEGEAYEREDPDPRVVDRLIYRAGQQYFDGGRSHVYLAHLDVDAAEHDGESDADTGAVTRVTAGDYDFVNPVWGDDATLYYAVKRTGDPDDNAVFDVLRNDLGGDPGTDDDDEASAGDGGGADPDGNATITATGVVEILFTTTGWLPDLAATSDGRVAYRRTPEEGLSMRQTDVEVYDRASGETTVLTDGLDRDVAASNTADEDLGMAWDPADERLYFATPDEGHVVLRRVPGDGSGDPEVVVRSGHLTGFSVGRDAVAYSTSEWDHPGDVFVSTPGGAETNRLTRLNADYLDGRAVREPEELWFESDGEQLQGWLLTPPDFDPDEQYPLAVEIHGGPHAMWSTAGTMWHEFQTLAARGYVVFWSNPRGSTGYGEAHATAIEADWGEVTTRDVLAGADLVCERDYVDETQQFVTGGSFGGYMTGWLVGHTDRFAGAVAQRGVYDLASFYGSTDAFKLIEWDYGTTPWESPEALWADSPVAHADAVETPTLVVHADLDFRVPVNNGEMFYLFLKKNGVETRLVRYPREGHELSRSGEPGHVVDRIERIARWFDGYSGHHDVSRALDRGDDGLSAGAEDDGE
jgi:dipeptidyl aminopeptidase/acylaminoacyl peptidase